MKVPVAVISGQSKILATEDWPLTNEQEVFLAKKKDTIKPVSTSPMDMGLLEQMTRLMKENDLNTVDVRDGDKRVILKRGALIAAGGVTAYHAAILHRHHRLPCNNVRRRHWTKLPHRRKTRVSFHQKPNGRHVLCLLVARRQAIRHRSGRRSMRNPTSASSKR